MYFQQLLQERDEVCPFLYIIEGVEAFVHLLRVLLELWIGCVSRGCRRCRRETRPDEARRALGRAGIALTAVSAP